MPSTVKHGTTLALLVSLAVVVGTLRTYTAPAKAAEDGCFGWLCRKTVTLTDAQIKALPTTPVTLVAAPGAGKMVFFQSAVWRVNAAAGAYSGFKTYTFFTVGGSAQGQYNEASQGVFAHAGDVVITMAPIQAIDDNSTSGQWLDNAASLANFSLDVRGINSDNGIDQVDLTGGNAANTLTITVYYTIVDVP